MCSCPSSQIASVGMLGPTTLIYASSDPATTSHYLGALYPSSICSLEIESNINLTLPKISPYYSYSTNIITELSMGESSVLNIGTGVCTLPGLYLFNYLPCY